MTREQLLWILVAFFGGSVVFGLIIEATKDSSYGVTLLAQLGALALIVAFITVIVRRRQ